MDNIEQAFRQGYTDEMQKIAEESKKKEKKESRLRSIARGMLQGAGSGALLGAGAGGGGGAFLAHEVKKSTARAKRFNEEHKGTGIRIPLEHRRDESLGEAALKGSLSGGAKGALIGTTIGGLVGAVRKRKVKKD